MLTLHSFLQNVIRVVKKLLISNSKMVKRTAAVLFTGLLVTTVVTLSSGYVNGEGKNVLAAFNDSTYGLEEMQETEPEETVEGTQAKIQVELTDSRKQAQFLVGSLLAKDMKQAIVEETAGIEQLQTETVMQAENAAQIELDKQNNAVISYSEADYDVFLKIVEAEAGDCGVIGKILVANVIINRVKSDKFPDSITDVIYEKRQFSPVANGSIDRVKVTQETIDCVDRALAGEDYSEDALFFMMRSASDSSNIKWFDRDLKWLFKHGVHEFFTYY